MGANKLLHKRQKGSQFFLVMGKVGVALNTQLTMGCLSSCNSSFICSMNCFIFLHMCKGDLRLEIDIINKAIKLSEHCVRRQDESSDSEETLKNFNRFLKSSHLLLGFTAISTNTEDDD